jgi:crotonobetainyl-CoA:carnitine CoA-transferase CaiB-like acyl-CoA transferase
VRTLDADDVPCHAVMFPEEMYDDPHVVANGLMLTLDHPVVGGLRMPASPLRLSGTPPVEPSPPPVLGADGPAVLRDLGYDEVAIERLLDERVLVTRDRLLEES